jgi:hypothetical protein
MAILTRLFTYLDGKCIERVYAWRSDGPTEHDVRGHGTEG